MCLKEPVRGYMRISLKNDCIFLTKYTPLCNKKKINNICALSHAFYAAHFLKSLDVHKQTVFIHFYIE